MAPDSQGLIRLNLIQRMLSLALTIQDRFSLIAYISDAYVAVSHDYIRPAISLLERLATVKDHLEMNREMDDWIELRTKSASYIADFTTKASEEVDISVRKNIAALQKRAIEAKEEDDEEDDKEDDE